jgi:hypothetical protein
MHSWCFSFRLKDIIEKVGTDAIPVDFQKNSAKYNEAMLLGA